MEYLEEKIEYGEYILDIEIFYRYNDSGNAIQLYHTFFVLKDNKVQEDYPEDIAPYVHQVVNDIFENKGYRFTSHV
jgi:hypothetical protein